MALMMVHMSASPRRYGPAQSISTTTRLDDGSGSHRLLYRPPGRHKRFAVLYTGTFPQVLVRYVALGHNDGASGDVAVVNPDGVTLRYRAGLTFGTGQHS